MSVDHKENIKPQSVHRQKQVTALREENRQLKERLNELEAAQTKKENQALRLAEYIIDNSPAILFRRLAAEKLEDRKMVYVSPNISRFGYKAEDLLSSKIMFRDFVYHEDTDRVRKEIDQSVDADHKQYSQYYRIVTKNGELRWVEDRTSVVEDDDGVRYHQGIVIDIHERKEAEEKLRISEEKYRQIVETTCEGFVLMDASQRVIDVNTAFVTMMGSPPAELIGTSPFELFGGFDVMLSESNSGSAGEEFREFETRLTSADGSLTPVLIHANSLRSDNGQVLGIMAFVTDISEHKKALILAGEVQKSLLPDAPPEIPGFDIAGTNIACEEVGGDYFDYLKVGSDQSFSVVVGDISGHGVDSALLMSSGRAFLRMRASQPGTSAEIISALNRHLCEDVGQSGRFMTLFYLHFNQAEKRVEWVRAGHDPALVYNPKNDHFVELKGPGLALGVDPDFAFNGQCRTNLQDGQIYLVFTDGLWEACNADGEDYGKERLRDCLRRCAHLNADEILAEILSDQKMFQGTMRNEDDITLVVIKLAAEN